LQWIGFRETASAFEELLAFSKAQELYMFLPYHGNSWVSMFVFIYDMETKH